MADTQMQKSAPIGQSTQQEIAVPKDPSKLLEKQGGFATVKGFIPAISDLNPQRPVSRKMFLCEDEYRDQRKKLIQELDGWIKILNQQVSNLSDYEVYCEKQIEEGTKLLNKNITTALSVTADLETSYRALDTYFRNTGCEKLDFLQILNATPDDFKDNTLLDGTVNDILKEGFDQISLADNFSIMVLPGYKLKSFAQRNEWAIKAHEYKVMLITDAMRSDSFDQLYAKTEEYKQSDKQFQNMIVTGNWIKGRDSEMLSETEKWEKAFFIPASAALAGKLCDEKVTIAQAASGEEFGTLLGIEDVEIALYKKEIEKLRANNIVPVICSEGRVMAYYNSNLYNGAEKNMREYSIVRVYDYLEKVLKHYVHKQMGPNWDPNNSADNIQKQIQKYLDGHKGFGKMYEDCIVKEPKMGDDGFISVDVEIKPFLAANSFRIQITDNTKSEDN